MTACGIQKRLLDDLKYQRSCYTPAYLNGGVERRIPDLTLLNGRVLTCHKLATGYGNPDTTTFYHSKGQCSTWFSVLYVIINTLHILSIPSHTLSAKSVKEVSLY